MSKKRIIFVDDETNILDGLRRMLRKHRDEWDMVFVTSGAEALAKMAAAPFDAMVTDLQMPGMHGVELLEKVQKAYPRTARITLSGHVEEGLGARAMKVAHQSMAKPADADKLKQTVADACKAAEAVRNEQLGALAAACATLPSLPDLYVRLAQAMESENATAKDIARIIECDMAMSAKLLQLVNSSFFGIARRVSSIEQTVALLGMLRLKALALGESVFKQFVTKRSFNGFTVAALWQHSLAVAELARRISREEHQEGDRPDQAFMAGLLHDIGVLLLAWQRPDALDQCLAAVQTGSETLWQSELAVLGTTHAEIGGYLLGLWGLPPRITEAVALHHSPSELAYDGLCATTVVHVADALISELGQAGEPNWLGPGRGALDLAYLERTQLAHRLECWMDLARETCAAAAAASV